MTDIVLPQVVFTDLDGTLLDLDTYSFAPALPAVQALLNRGVPIVFCSAKTRSEQEVYRQQMMTRDPFIVENGGCIFIPEGYFPFEFQYDRVADGYILIELGTPYREIREALKRLKAEKDFNLRGFGDMSVEEVAAITGLDLEMARRARQREYSETLTEANGPLKVEQALEALTEVGLNWTHGGRFYGVMGSNDKGRAASILIELFKRKLGRIRTVGLGDSLNDLPLLAAVDTPILVQKPQGSWEKVELPNLRLVTGVGPVGWKRAIAEFVLTDTPEQGGP